MFSEEVFKKNSLIRNIYILMYQIEDGNFNYIILIKVFEIILDFCVRGRRKLIISNIKTMLEITVIKTSSKSL